MRCNGHKWIDCVPRIFIFSIMQILALVLLPFVGANTKTDYAFIVSSQLNQFDKVIEGFKESYPQASLRVFDMQGRSQNEQIKNFLEKEKPKVIIALGALAATSVVSVEKKRPIIFSMVINYKRYTELRQKNVTGVSMEIPPAMIMTQCRMLYPSLNSLAVPYHPQASAEIIADAKPAASGMRMSLVPIVVTRPEQIKTELKKYQKSYAGLWMVADVKLYNKNTLAWKELIDYSRDEKKPLIAFSEPFVKQGAFLSVSINYTSLGSQLALVGRQIELDEVPPAKIAVTHPIGTLTVLNSNTAKHILGSGYDEAIVYEVDKVYPENAHY